MLAPIKLWGDKSYEVPDRGTRGLAGVARDTGEILIVSLSWDKQAPDISDGQKSHPDLQEGTGEQMVETILLLLSHDHTLMSP